MMTVRDFLYLDHDLVRSFLAQLEGGQIDEERSRETRSVSGEAALNLSLAGVGAKAGGGGNSQRETEMVIRQVAASEFERLYNLLDDAKEITLIERATAAEDVAEVKRKAFVEFDGRVKNAGLGPLMEGVAQFFPMLEMMQSIQGTTLNIDEAAKTGISALSKMSGGLSHTAVTVAIPGGLGFMVAAELKREFVLATKWDVDATAFVRVQRVLREEETFVIGDPTGGLLAAISEENRNQLSAALQSPEATQLGLDTQLQVSAPAVVVTPLAIFR